MNSKPGDEFGNRNTERLTSIYLEGQGNISYIKTCGCSKTPRSGFCNMCQMVSDNGKWSSDQSTQINANNVNSVNNMAKHSLGSKNDFYRPHWAEEGARLTEDAAAETKPVGHYKEKNILSEVNSMGLPVSYREQKEQRVSAMFSYSAGHANEAHFLTDYGTVSSTEIYGHHVKTPIVEESMQKSAMHPFPCSQMFSQEDRSSRYFELYMQTPKFSSEKFVSANLNVARDEYMHQECKIPNNNSSSNINSNSNSIQFTRDNIRLRINPMTSTDHLSRKVQTNLTNVTNVVKDKSAYNDCTAANVQSYPHEMFPRHSHSHSMPMEAPKYGENLALPMQTHFVMDKPFETDRKEPSVIIQNEKTCTQNINMYINCNNNSASCINCCKNYIVPYYSLKNAAVAPESEKRNEVVIRNDSLKPANSVATYENQMSAYLKPPHIDTNHESHPPLPAEVYSSHIHTQISYKDNTIVHPANNHSPDPHKKHSFPALPKEKSYLTTNIPKDRSVICERMLPLKKAGAPKPNYRELLKYAMRNSISEEEMNLKIIKKTLNVVAPGPKTKPQGPSPSSHPDALTRDNPKYVLQTNVSSASNRSDASSFAAPKILTPGGGRVECSPLDLSMRTIKKSADSSERTINRQYKDMACPLPKVEFIPNFSLLSMERKDSKQLDNKRSCDVTLNALLPVESLPMQPDCGLSKAMCLSNAPMSTVVVRKTNEDSTYEDRRRTFEAFGRHEHPLTNSTTNVTSASMPTRPTVLQTNPHVRSAPKPPTHELVAASSSLPVCSVGDNYRSAQQKTSSTAYNSNDLSRKRNLPEVVTLSCSEPRLKQACAVNLYSNAEKETRIDSAMVPSSTEIKESLETPVHEDGFKGANVSTSVGTALICEPKGLVSPRIRTKAELKGFNFNPMVQPGIGETPPEGKLSLKKEFEGEFSQESFFDIDWTNTCNGFVKQLLTTTKHEKVDFLKLPAVMKSSPYEEDSLFSTFSFSSNVKEDSNHVQPTKEPNPLSHMQEKVSSSNSFNDQKRSNISEGTSERNESMLGSDHSRRKLQNDRGILRLKKENRLAERYQNESSSETDSELIKRKTERSKKSVKKGKLRSQAAVQRNGFSDCGSDSSTNVKGEWTNRLKDGMSKSSSGVSNRGSQSENKSPSRKEKSCANSTAPQRTTDRKGPRADESKTTSKSGSGGSKGNNKMSSRMKAREAQTRLLNTMTRSKRKKELEMQLANSKVLRNEKIINNSPAESTRKYTRKGVNNKALILKNRLRSNSARKTILNNAVKQKEAKKKKVAQANAEKGLKQERHRDLFLEVYRFKRSLKVPPSLITIKDTNYHKASASLSDNDNLMSYVDRRRKMAKLPPKSTDSKSIPVPSKKTPDSGAPLPPTPHRSIIDLLHSRVISTNKPSPNSTATSIVKPKLNETMAKTKTANKTDENSQSCEMDTTSVFWEPILSAEKLKSEDSNEAKKRHFSIFETKVLQTKTRTESKMQQRNEFIREIFVGDDRPASAPPNMIQSLDSMDLLTNDVKYDVTYLRKLNALIKTESGGRTNQIENFSSRSMEAHGMTLKQEVDKDEDHFSTPTVAKLIRRRPGKYIRRKGSSGFDYIRKKKKPVSASIHNQNASIKVEAIEEDEAVIGTKTEQDIGQEIHKWVLNKGVGQSTIHKAAKLGYIDVIIYCLDRLQMNPNQKDNAGYTALHEACTNGWLAIARVLLQYGANHSAAAHSGIRPLHVACESNDIELVRLLLSYGADPLLATYSGQTPLKLTSSKTIRAFLTNYLKDIQSMAATKEPWRFNGPWQSYDETVCGYDLLRGAPEYNSKILTKSVGNTKGNLKYFKQNIKRSKRKRSELYYRNMSYLISHRSFSKKEIETISNNSDSDGDGDVFEFEESSSLLPPLYLLEDEGNDKWVLLSDLCNLLKVKSKDTLLNKICPSSSVNYAPKGLTRELKMCDFLKKATCIQLLCAGEKINICASKVVLIKYNESVKSLLGVETLLMKF